MVAKFWRFFLSKFISTLTGKGTQYISQEDASSGFCWNYNLSDSNKLPLLEKSQKGWLIWSKDPCAGAGVLEWPLFLSQCFTVPMRPGTHFWIHATAHWSVQLVTEYLLWARHVGGKVTLKYFVGGYQLLYTDLFVCLNCKVFKHTHTYTT